jgi:hypothetical protein
VRIAYRRKALHRRQREIAERLARPRDGATPLDDAITAEVRERMWLEVARLPEKYRDPVVLHHLQGVPTPEVALLLDLPEATVRTHLHRGRELLRWGVSPRLAHGFLCVPWFFADAIQGGGTPLSPTAAAGTVTVAALLGVSAGFVLSPRVPAAPLDDAASLASPAMAATAEDTRLLDTLRGERAQLIESLAAARRRESAALDRESSANAATIAPAPALSGVEFAATFRSTLRRGPGEPDLDALSWGTLGVSLAEIVRLRTDLARSMARDEVPEGRVFGRIQELNGPLVTAALELHALLDAETVNTAFTHPSFSARAVEATLAAAGLPLERAQRDALESLASRYAGLEADRARQASMQKIHLARIVAAANLRQEFFDAVDGLLSPEQRDVLHPEVVRGRLGADLFSSGLVWMEVVSPVRFLDEEDFVAKVSRHVMKALPAEAMSLPLVQERARSFLRSLPEERRGKRENPADQNGEILIDEASDLAARMVRMLEEIAAAVPGESSAGDNVRELVIVPLPVFRGGDER